MKRGKYLRRWVRHLRAAGLPAAHCACVLAIDLVEVEAIPLHTPWDKPLRLAQQDKRPLRGGPDTSNKIRRLSELGYSDATISDILRIQESSVRDCLSGRAQRSQEAKLRRQEERAARLKADRLRRDRNAARRAARRKGARLRRKEREARWPQVADVSYDSSSKLPAAELLAEVPVLDPASLSPPASPMFFEPNRWDGPIGNHGILSPLDKQKIRWAGKHVAQSGRTRAELVRLLACQFGVSTAHIYHIIKQGAPCPAPL